MFAQGKTVGHAGNIIADDAGRAVGIAAMPALLRPLRPFLREL